MKAIYKCRLCGEVFKYEITEKDTVSITRQPSENDFAFKIRGKEIVTKKYMLHAYGGHFGYAEFCGFKGDEDK